VADRGTRVPLAVNWERAELSMSPGNETGWSGAASVLLRSYVSGLRSWTAGIAVSYAIGVALVVGRHVDGHRHSRGRRHRAFPLH
jgi:hypothetical protein